MRSSEVTEPIIQGFTTKALALAPSASLSLPPPPATTAPLLHQMRLIADLFDELAWWPAAEQLFTLAASLHLDWHPLPTDGQDGAPDDDRSPTSISSEDGGGGDAVDCAATLERFGIHRRIGLVQAEQCKFVEAAASFNMCETLAATHNQAIVLLDRPTPTINPGLIASDRGELAFLQSHYHDAWACSATALQAGSDGMEPRDRIQILRRASLIAVVKREIETAKKLIDAALHLAVFHNSVTDYAALLESYAHYLLNCDDPRMATKLLQRALGIRDKTLGKLNLRRATVLEFLAYSLYGACVV
jgi:hypothetical protein